MAGANDVTNTTSFVEATQYSQFILNQLHDGLLPDSFTRNVSDFTHGSTLNIKTIGTVTLQDVEDNVPITYNPIDSGVVQFSLTDYVGAGWAILDTLREDGSQVEQLHAAQAQEVTRAIQEYYETRFLAVANAAQTAANQNVINGFDHRVQGGGANDTVAVSDFANMRLSFDKANAPMAGRIAIVDPIVEMTLNNLVTLTTGTLDRNPKFQGALENGFAQNHNFVMNLFGWDIWTSNRCPDITAESLDDFANTGAAAVTGKAAIFMCIADDNCKPIMNAWRRMPKVEAGRNKELMQDEFVESTRFGFGAQRVDTIGVVVHSATAYV